MHCFKEKFCRNKFFVTAPSLYADLDVDEDEEELHLLPLALKVDLPGRQLDPVHSADLQEAVGGLAVLLRVVVEDEVEGDEDGLEDELEDVLDDVGAVDDAGLLQGVAHFVATTTPRHGFTVGLYSTMYFDM